MSNCKYSKSKKKKKKTTSKKKANFIPHEISQDCSLGFVSYFPFIIVLATFSLRLINVENCVRWVREKCRT